MVLRAVKPEALEKRLKMLVYGPAGVGKTTAAIQFPHNYILDLERGCDHYAEVIKASKSAVFQTTNPDDIKAEVKALLTEKHIYRTLTIDPITQFYGGLQDKWNLIFSKSAQDQGKSAEQIQMADWGFRYWARVKSEYKSVTRMAMQLDMNLIVTSHQKDIYGTGMQRVGIGPDSMKGDDYLFDYVFQLDNIGGKRMARTIKERAPVGKNKFPAEFIWSYENFCKYYGQEVLEKESKPVSMALPAQVAEIKGLLETVKVEEDWVSKCFTKADVEDWTDMDFDTLEKCIQHLKKKMNPVKAVA